MMKVEEKDYWSDPKQAWLPMEGVGKWPVPMTARYLDPVPERPIPARDNKTLEFKF